MATPAATPPSAAPDPKSGTGTVRTTSAASATSKGAEQAGAKPKSRPSPKRWMLIAATAALGIELVLLLLLLIRSGSAARIQKDIDRLTRTQLQADMIREAYVELESQAASLKARLGQSAKSLGELKKRIMADAKSAGVAVRIRELSNKKEEAGQLLRITGSGSEGRILNLLKALDSIPAVVETENLQLTGTGPGKVSLELTLLYHELKPRDTEVLKAFVDQLRTEEHHQRSTSRLPRTIFMQAVLGKDQALKGWPKILLSGFSADQALFLVDDEAQRLDPGRIVTSDITYVAKLAVNQALLKRKRDGAEIILAVGNPNFTLKPRKGRGMSEFVLNIPKRASSELFTVEK